MKQTILSIESIESLIITLEENGKNTPTDEELDMALKKLYPDHYKFLSQPIKRTI